MERERKIFLTLDKKNHGDNIISKTKPKNKKYVTSDSITLDELTKKFDKRKFIIKIDVQGSESLVLKYGKKTLLTKPPLILEFAVNLYQNKGFNEIIDSLLNAKYKYFYDVSENSQNKTALNYKNYFLKIKNLKAEDSITDLLFI